MKALLLCSLLLLLSFAVRSQQSDSLLQHEREVGVNVLSLYFNDVPLIPEYLEILFVHGLQYRYSHGRHGFRHQLNYFQSSHPGYLLRHIEGLPPGITAYGISQGIGIWQGYQYYIQKDRVSPYIFIDLGLGLVRERLSAFCANCKYDDPRMPAPNIRDNYKFFYIRPVLGAGFRYRVFRNLCLSLEAGQHFIFYGAYATLRTISIPVYYRPRIQPFFLSVQKVF